MFDTFLNRSVLNDNNSVQVWQSVSESIIIYLHYYFETVLINGLTTLNTTWGSHSVTYVGLDWSRENAEITNSTSNDGRDYLDATVLKETSPHHFQKKTSISQASYGIALKNISIEVCCSIVSRYVHPLCANLKNIKY